MIKVQNADGSITLTISAIEQGWLNCYLEVAAKDEQNALSTRDRAKEYADIISFPTAEVLRKAEGRG